MKSKASGKSGALTAPSSTEPWRNRPQESQGLRAQDLITKTQSMLALPLNSNLPFNSPASKFIKTSDHLTWALMQLTRLPQSLHFSFSPGELRGWKAAAAWW